MDEQGYLYITGRESDMYISGGSNVYPREIEEKILAYGPIREVCVLGVPDPKWGEIGVMVGVLKDGAQWGPEERSEEHTSELQSLMRISYAVFCLQTKTRDKH